MEFDVGLVHIYPTDTVWGVGSLHCDVKLNRFINSIKGYSQKKDLSILFPSLVEVHKYFDLTNFLENDRLNYLHSNFEITFLYPKSWLKKEYIQDFNYIDSEKIGVRCLSYKWIKDIYSQISVLTSV